MTDATAAASQGAGSVSGRGKTRWVVLGFVVAVLIVGGWLLWSGRLGIDISQYFAYEPAGYVPPNCGWHGDAVSAQYPSCCAGIQQVGVTWVTPTPTTSIPPTPTPTPTLTVEVTEPLGTPVSMEEDGGSGHGAPVPDVDSDAIARFPNYCVWPSCEAVAREVQCIQAPCEPVIEFVCPPGVTPPPRPPTYPGPEYTVVLNQGLPVEIPSVVPVALRSNYGAAIQGSFTVVLHKRGWGDNRFIIHENAKPEPVTSDAAVFQWDTTLPVVNQRDRSPQDLADMVGSDLYLYVYDSDGDLVGAAGSFYLLAEGTTTPYKGVMVGLGSARGVTSPGTTVRIPITLGRGDAQPIPSDPYFVTGFDSRFVMREGHGRFIGYENSTALPDIIEESLIAPDGQSIHIAIGTGAGGEGIMIGNVPIGNLVIEVDGPSDNGTLCYGTDFSVTEISARDIEGNVFDKEHEGGWWEYTCFAVAETANVPGDADGDGDVDIFDYNIVVTNFGGNGPGGDLDGDGDVDIFDYNLVVSNFGS